jgi:glycosyltransferase involved in cell wall biosynthesis
MRASESSALRKRHFGFLPCQQPAKARYFNMFRELHELHERSDPDAQSSILIVEPGSGGHRHVHLRLIFEHLNKTNPGALHRVWIYAPLETANRVADSLDPQSASIFRSRLIVGPTCSGFSGLRKTAEMARNVGAQRVLFLELDSFIYALTVAGIGAQVAGVWFRPSYHYSRHHLFHEGSRQRLLGVVKRLVCRTLCRQERIQRLLVFDPWAAEYARSEFLTDKIRYVPDPYGSQTSTVAQNTSPVRARRVLAVLGAISKRKGIYSILAALRLLDPSQQRQIELRVIGSTAERERDCIQRALAAVRGSTDVQVTHVGEFVSDSILDQEIEHADSLLLIYQRFVGSSGLLIRAALCGRPVIATRCGLVGAQVRGHRLGLTVNPTDPQAIARAISAVVASPGSYCDPVAARHFASMHTPDRYLREISTLVLGGLYELNREGQEHA